MTDSDRSCASVVLPSGVHWLKSDIALIPLRNVESNNFAFCDLEMAQISFNWHKFGDMRAEMEF